MYSITPCKKNQCFFQKNLPRRIISQKSADWDSQFEVIKDVIAEPFVQKYIDFFDTQTMAARLRNKESMSFEFKKRMGNGSLP